MLILDDPPFDWGAYRERPGVPEARLRQLEPLQGPALARLRSRGAESVNTYWLANAIFASVEARYLAETLCYPGVRVVQVDRGFYEVVEPPWSAEGVGAAACPLTSGGCPEHCTEVRGECLPGPSACPPESSPVVACSRQELVASNWQAVCRVERSTGRRYAFRLIAPTEPGYVGWRECTAEEANGVGPVH